MAYKGDDGRTYASKSSYNRAKRLGLTGKSKSSSSSRSSSSSSRSSGSSTSSSSSSGYRAPDGRIYSSQSAYERTQALRSGDDQPRSQSNTVTEIDSQQAAEEQRTREILARYGSPAVQQQFEVVRRQPEGTSRPVFIPEDEFDEDRDYGDREVIQYPTSAEGYSDEEVARQVSSQIPQATQESFDRQVQYRERVEQNIFDYGSDEVKFQSAEAGLLTGDRTPELTFKEGFKGYFSDKPRVVKDVAIGVGATLLLAGLGPIAVVGTAARVVAGAAAIKYTVDTGADILATPKEYRGYKFGKFSGEFIALSGGLGSGGLSAKGIAKGSKAFLTKTKIGKGVSTKLKLRNEQPKYLAATNDELSAVELLRPLPGSRKSTSGFILQNPDRVPKNTPGIIIQDNIFTPFRRGGGAGRLDTKTRLFTQDGDPIPQTLQITRSGLQFDPTISSSVNVLGSPSGSITRSLPGVSSNTGTLPNFDLAGNPLRGQKSRSFDPTLRDVRLADTRGNKIVGKDFAIRIRGDDFDPRIASGPRKGETFGEKIQAGPYKAFSFPDYRYSPKGFQIPKLGSRGAITLPRSRPRSITRSDLDLDFGSVSRTRARSRSRSAGTTVTTPDFSKLISRPRTRFAAVSAYGVANIYGSASRSSLISATQSGLSLGTRSTSTSITGLRGITSGGTSLGGFGTFNFKGPTGIKLPKLRGGSRSRSFSTGRSRSNFKTFSSVTAAAFNIRGSKKQRRRSKFTGLEIIGLQ